MRTDTIERNKSFEQRNAVKNSWKNPKIAEARKKGISKANKIALLGHKCALGHRISEKVKKKVLKNLIPYKKGSKHPFWKGGVTTINKRIRTSKEYKLWRKAIFERDHYTRIFCGQFELP